MLSVNRLSLLLIVCSLALLPACGGGGNHVTPTPPPSGGFSPSDLSGAYIFSTTGSDANSGFLVIVGTFTANGSGGITGGTLDMNDPGFSGPVQGLAITGGKYTLTSDGRGQITLNAATPFARTLGLDFVLTSNSHGAVTEFDQNGSGSGSLDLQGSVTISGSYAFSLSGIDSGGSPLATVGSFTLGSGGAITAGVEDFNDANAFTSQPITGGTVAGGAPGTATLTTAGALGTLSFDVYAVDSTHLKFIETGGGALLAGDAFTQQGAALPTTQTTFVFTMAGLSSGGPLGVGGFMPINGAGNISNGLVDINNAGTVSSSPLNFTGSYLASGSVGGRTLFNVSGFTVAAQFVGYPTASAGLQLLESDGTGFLSGTAFAQSSPTPSLQSSQGYAVGLSAANLTNAVEEDDIAEFTTSTSTVSGIIDINDQGNLNFDQRLSGNYTADSPATGRGAFTSNGFNGVFYAIDGSTALFLETDSNQVGTGIFQLQNSGAQAGMVSSQGMSVVQPVAHSIRSKRKN